MNVPDLIKKLPLISSNNKWVKIVGIIIYLWAVVVIIDGIFGIT
jgi:hypothetical protein